MFPFIRLHITNERFVVNNTILSKVVLEFDRRPPIINNTSYSYEHLFGIQKVSSEGFSEVINVSLLRISRFL